VGGEQQRLPGGVGDPGALGGRDEQLADGAVAENSLDGAIASCLEQVRQGWSGDAFEAVVAGDQRDRRVFGQAP